MKSTIEPGWIYRMILPVINEFKEIYRKSGINTPYRDYVKWFTILTSMTFILSGILYTYIHSQILALYGKKLIYAVLSLTLTSCSLVIFILLYYPLYRRNQTRLKIENSIVYTLSYMTILSACGIHIDRIMERISEVEKNPSIKQLATKFIIGVRLLGLDVISALEETSQRNPSETLSKLIASVRNTTQTSGDLKNLLQFEVDKELQRKRVRMKEMMATLTYLGEIYVTLLVVTPILFILMLTIVSVIGFSSTGTSTITQLNLMVFVGIPVLAIGLLIVLDTIVEGEE